jgi:hypothetical protein
VISLTDRVSIARDLSRLSSELGTTASSKTANDKQTNSLSEPELVSSQITKALFLSDQSVLASHLNIWSR